MLSYVIVIGIIFAFSLTGRGLIDREFKKHGRTEKFQEMNDQFFSGSMIILIIGILFVASFFVGVMSIAFFIHNHVLCNIIISQLDNLAIHGVVIMCTLGLSQSIGGETECCVYQDKRRWNHYTFMSPG